MNLPGLTVRLDYTYDGDGRRVQKSTGKLYWYRMGSDPLAETDAAGNPCHRVRRLTTEVLGGTEESHVSLAKPQMPR